MGDGALTGAITGAIQGGMSGYSGYLKNGACFVAGTTVATATGLVAIEKIRAGDLVWAWDEETGDVALKPVVETYINEPTELFNSIYTNPWLYSAVYNGSYVLIDLVLCLVILAVLSTPMRKYLRGDDLKAMRGE